MVLHNLPTFELGCDTEWKLHHFARGLNCLSARTLKGSLVGPGNDTPQTHSPCPNDRIFSEWRSGKAVVKAPITPR